MSLAHLLQDEFQSARAASQQSARFLDLLRGAFDRLVGRQRSAVVLRFQSKGRA